MQMMMKRKSRNDTARVKDVSGRPRRRRVAVVIAGLGMTAGSAVLAPGTAGAATPAQKPAVASPMVSTSTSSAATGNYYCPRHGECFAHVFSGAKLWLRTGGYINLPANDTVEITCYYGGASSPYDPYWDHVVWENGIPPRVGHVWDGWVNFNGLEPPQLPGHPLSHC